MAAKLQMPCAHVEAGLRSFDRSMPEEINRIVTDRVADILLTPSADADENLLAEGASVTSIHRVGNVMIDTLLTHLDLAKQRPILDSVGVTPGAYAVATMHRRSNVDDPAVLESLLGTLEWILEAASASTPDTPRRTQRSSDAC